MDKNILKIVYHVVDDFIDKSIFTCILVLGLLVADYLIPYESSMVFPHYIEFMAGILLLGEIIGCLINKYENKKQLKRIECEIKNDDCKSRNCCKTKKEIKNK